MFWSLTPDQHEDVDLNLFLRCLKFKRKKRIGLKSIKIYFYNQLWIFIFILSTFKLNANSIKHSFISFYQFFLAHGILSFHCNEIKTAGIFNSLYLESTTTYWTMYIYCIPTVHIYWIQMVVSCEAWLPAIYNSSSPSHVVGR